METEVVLEKKLPLKIRPIQIRLSIEEFNELIKVTEEQGFGAYSVTARVAIKNYIKEKKVS